MDASETTRSGAGPAAVYRERLESLRRAQTAGQRREKLLGYSKLGLAALTLIAATLLLHHLRALELLIVPTIGFIVLAVAHEKLLQSLRMRARSIRFYERGVARLEDSWAGTGERGEHFLDAAHPYARDLDIFGEASLFELVCTARTRAGEQTLAAWLLAAAPVEEILLRHGAVRDLEERVDFRERLFTLAETVRLGVHPDALAAWGDGKPIFDARSTRIVTSILGLLWIASLVCWGVWGLGDAALVMSLVNLAWAHRLHARLDQCAAAIERATDDMALLAGVLAHIEREQFSSEKLLTIQAVFARDGVAPSLAIKKLARIVDTLKSRNSLLGRALDLFTFWSAQLVFMAERWQCEFGPAIRGWLAEVGEFEALTSLSAYAYEHPRDVFPEFVVGAALFDAQGLAHPLLPAAKAVRNDVRLGAEMQLMILSGPNMAGKSTFIRAVGVNAVLAQCGAPVRAARLTLSQLNVAASICILDSLSGGISRFYAEIHRVKLISDLAHGPVPVLFLLDELLSGTNSHDRLAGTEFIVRSLVERNAIGIVSTHDLALARIPETLGERAVNCHFEDSLINGQLIFDYKLKAGVVKTSNALELMRSIGFGISSG